MKEYILLQLRMTSRKMVQAGVHPILGYVLGIAGLVILVEYLYSKTAYAGALVLIFVLSFLFNLSKKDRTEFMILAFGDLKAQKLRMVENLLFSLPFIILIVVNKSYIESLLLMLGCIVIASVRFKSNYHYTIPTPFARHPFEFIVGFRRTFLLIPITWILVVVAINAGNLNLGIFAIIIAYLVVMSYYLVPESEYFLWIYSCKPVRFLYRKLLLAARNATIIIFPITMAVAIFFPQKVDLVLMFFSMGMVFLWLVILAKYSAYPNEINVPEVILIMLSVYYLPLLLATMPFFYLKSIRKLKPLLK